VRSVGALNATLGCSKDWLKLIAAAVELNRMSSATMCKMSVLASFELDVCVMSI
jgi:hypothetical protein